MNRFDCREIFPRKSLLLVFLFFFQFCYRYHVVKEIKTDQKSIPNGDRIALVGFYPFKYQTIFAGNHSFALVTDLDTKNPTSLFIQNPKRLEEFPVKGIDPSVTSDHLKNFINEYRNYVGTYGDSELRKMIQWVGDPGSESYAFKKRDVDYYILAVHGPENDEQNYPNSFRLLLSVPFSVLTFGTIPVWGTRDVESIFYVYDKKLNLLGKKEFKNKYTVFSAWWGRKEEGIFYKELPDSFRSRLYRNDIENFLDFFPQLIPPIQK